VNVYLVIVAAIFGWKALARIAEIGRVGDGALRGVLLVQTVIYAALALFALAFINGRPV
jgi:hypothetical protein